MTPPTAEPFCSSCDHECKKLDNDGQCCLCADDRGPCYKCDNRLEGYYVHATTPAYGNGDR